MVRGNARKVKRGGGRNFSRHVGDAGDRNGRQLREEEEDESSEEEEDSEEEEEDEESSSEEEAAATTSVTTTAQQPALDRKEIRNQKKKDKQKKTGENGEDEDPDLINPNHVQQKMNISDLNTPRQLTRREREQKEKQDAKDRYWKLHVQGKTDEAKADLSRLAKIRAEREAAQAKRKAEAEAKAAEAEAKKNAQLAKRTTRFEFDLLFMSQ